MKLHAFEFRTKNYFDQKEKKISFEFSCYIKKDIQSKFNYIYAYIPFQINID
jgi:hypothetical protein